MLHVLSTDFATHLQRLRSELFEPSWSEAHILSNADSYSPQFPIAVILCPHLKWPPTLRTLELPVTSFLTATNATSGKRFLGLLSLILPQKSCFIGSMGENALTTLISGSLHHLLALHSLFLTCPSFSAWRGGRNRISSRPFRKYIQYATRNRACMILRMRQL